MRSSEVKLGEELGFEAACLRAYTHLILGEIGHPSSHKAANLARRVRILANQRRPRGSRFHIPLVEIVEGLVARACPARVEVLEQFEEEVKLRIKSRRH